MTTFHSAASDSLGKKEFLGDGTGTSAAPAAAECLGSRRLNPAGKQAGTKLEPAPRHATPEKFLLAIVANKLQRGWHGKQGSHTPQANAALSGYFVS